MPITLRTTLILAISGIIVVTSFVLWLLFEKSHQSLHEKSLDNMASMLSLITYDAKWRILLQNEYDESLLRYFSEEVWDKSENMAWVSIFDKQDMRSIFHMAKPGYENLKLQPVLNIMIAKYNSKQERSRFISEEYLPAQLKVFFYPVYGPVFESPSYDDYKSIPTESLLFEKRQAETDQIIGYVLIGISIKEIMEGLNQVFWKDIYITFGVMVLGIIIAFIVTRYLTRNITQLVKATHKITEGDFSYKIPIKSPYKELGKLEQAFNSMVEEIREVDRLKETFLVNMSHELRAPLHSIIGLSGALIREGQVYTQDQYRKGLSIIYTEGNQLLSQINPILDLAKTRAGKMEIQYDDIDLESLIMDISSATEGIILSKQKPIIFQAELLVKNKFIKTDEDKLKNILHNILSNAVKFTEKGRIELSIWNEDNNIVFKVRDTGVGIKPKDRQRVFQRFQQAEHSLTMKEEGVGLGMSLCKEYVQLLGGKIWLESKFGSGSSFYFKIPEYPRQAIDEKETSVRKFSRSGMIFGLPRWKPTILRRKRV